MSKSDHLPGVLEGRQALHFRGIPLHPPTMAHIAIEDLSGTTTPVTSNPYDGLITATKGDPAQLQARYQLHRTTRNDQQKEKILGPDFDGWILDEHLVKLDGFQKDPSYVDPRHCLVFWARPPQKVRKLVQIIQQKLKDAAPGKKNTDGLRCDLTRHKISG